MQLDNQNFNINSLENIKQVQAGHEKETSSTKHKFEQKLELNQNTSVQLLKNRNGIVVKSKKECEQFLIVISDKQKYLFNPVILELAPFKRKK